MKAQSPSCMRYQNTMDAQNKSVIFFDIDGTLCRYEDTVTPQVKDCFRRLHESGHECFLCTGRSPKDISQDILSLGFDGIISCMGAIITIGDSVIKNQYIPTEQMLETVGAIIDRKVPALILGIEEVLRTEQMTPSALETGVVRSRADLIKNGKPVQISSLDIEYPNISALGEIRELIAMHSELVEYSPCSGQTRLYGVTKAEAIHSVMNLTRYKGRKSYAVGDSQNDTEMLRYVDVGIAMGDAPQEVRQVAGYITKTVEENGIVGAMERFALI